MTTGLSWKAAYWPKIIEIKKKLEGTPPNQQWPYVYDNDNRIRMALNVERRDNHRGYYIYINTPELMQMMINKWDEFAGTNNYLNNFKSQMKEYERLYLHQIIYETRKEEFNALVAKINS